ncbi:hypothetical protein B9Z55_009807 [Caenorhabditis nigoni]|uniref:F-box domain-containing protein n=2 Tax=Caenorhabditis nigoni TaxID=1611254 RepID=A0A2G5UTL4_9PELO|nr:hypothetical protein B9Z55_009807 [Caenorhabditis nigoni]
MCSTSSYSSGMSVFRLPETVQAAILRNMSAYDIINTSFTSQTSKRIIRSYRYCISRPRFIIQIAPEMSRECIQIRNVDTDGTVLGQWIFHRSCKRPYKMDHIEEEEAVIRYSTPYEEVPTTHISSSHPTKTCKALLIHFRSVFRKMEFDVTFNGVVLTNEYLKQWRYLSLATSKLSFDCCFLDRKFNRAFLQFIQPNQEISIEDGEMDIRHAINAKKFTMNQAEYFNPEKFALYKAPHMDFPMDGISSFDFFLYIEQWIEGDHPKLKMVTRYGDKQRWSQFYKKCEKWTGGPRFHESEFGRFDCSNGYDIRSEDGTLGTFITDEEEELTRFVVWPKTH